MGHELVQGFDLVTFNWATISQLAKSLAWGGSSGNLWTPSLPSACVVTAPASYHNQRHHQLHLR